MLDDARARSKQRRIRAAIECASFVALASHRDARSTRVQRNVELVRCLRREAIRHVERRRRATKKEATDQMSHHQPNTAAVARLAATFVTFAIAACSPSPAMQPPPATDASVADTASNPPPADGGAGLGCQAICTRISQCAAEQGEQVSVAQCAQDCASAPPSAACVQCFAGPCATTCGGPCISCVSNQCQMPPPPPPPPEDSGVIDRPCGTGRLDPRIGRYCLFDQSCDGEPMICERFQGSTGNYCTQPCGSIADCPCEGGDWVCELVPGRSAVQRYCRDRRRVR